jgi:hypothetical protein
MSVPDAVGSVDRDLDPGLQTLGTHMFERAGCSLWEAGGFSWNLDDFLMEAENFSRPQKRPSRIRIRNVRTIYKN